MTDPLFLGLFLRAVFTVAGGLSMVVTAQGARGWQILAREPEWVSYTAPLLLLTLLGGADLWRYLTPLLPVVVVLCAHGSHACRPRQRQVLAVAAVALTIWTEQPFSRMDSAHYFADWFPYYIRSGLYPFSTAPPSIWPEWGWRLAVVGVATCVLAVYAHRRPVGVTA